MWNKKLARQLIDESGYKKKFVAQQVGLEPSTFSQYLYGKAHKPSREVLEKLATFLKIDVSELELKPQKVG